MYSFNELHSLISLLFSIAIRKQTTSGFLPSHFRASVGGFIGSIVEAVIWGVLPELYLAKEDYYMVPGFIVDVE